MGHSRALGCCSRRECSRPETLHTPDDRRPCQISSRGDSLKTTANYHQEARKKLGQIKSRTEIEPQLLQKPPIID